MPSFRGGRGGGVSSPGVLMSSVWIRGCRRAVYYCSIRRRNMIIICFAMVFVAFLRRSHYTLSSSESSTPSLRATSDVVNTSINNNMENSSVCLSSPGRYKWRKDLDQYFTKQSTTEGGIRMLPTYAITLTVNSGYFDFFINWHHYYVEHTTNNHNSNSILIIIAEDSLIYTKLQTMFHGDDDDGNTIVLPGYDVATTNNNSNQSSMTMHNSNAEDYDSIKYKSLVSTRASHLLNLICSLEATTKKRPTTNDKKDIIIIYSDVDTVFVKDPFPYIDNMLISSSSSSTNTQYDILAAIDDHDYGGVSDYYCTGFIVIVQTHASISFLAHWEKELITKPQLNQPIFNTVLRSTKIPIKHAGLGEIEFAPGRLYFNVWEKEGGIVEKTKKEKTIFVHNNYIVGHDAKRKRFEENGLWN